MGDAPTKPAAKAATTPTMTKVHRAVHELRTGPDVEDKIDAGSLLTDDVLKAHGLDDKTIDDLVGKGAIDFVEVLKG